MLGSPLKTFDHRYFYSMNNRDDGQVIPDYYAINIENWITRNIGELVMRDGLTAKGTNPATTNLGAAEYSKAGTSKKLIRVINGAANTTKFQYSDDEGATWSDISGGGSKTTGVKWIFTQANDVLYGVNGVDTPVKISGNTPTSATVVGIPQGTAVHYWQSALWVIGNPTYKDRLYFSDPAAPETFGGSSYINVNLGDESTGIGLFGTAGTSGRLFIGKERSIWFITGTTAASFVLNTLTYEHGIASHEAMCEVGGAVWALDREGNVRRLYRSVSDTPFTSLASTQIQATVAGLNKAALYKASAVVFNNFAMFFVPNGVDDYNSLVLVWDEMCNLGKGGWITFTGWNIARATVSTGSTIPKLILYDARTSNGQPYQWSGYSDNGIAITARYETKIYDFGYAAQEKQIVYSYQFAQAQGTVPFRFYCSTDRFYYVKLKEFNLQGTDNKLLGVDWTLGVDKLGSDGFVKQKIFMYEGGGDNTGTSFQTKLEAQSSTTHVKVRNFTQHYRVRGLH